MSHLFGCCWGELTVMFDFNLKSLVGFSPGKKQSHLEGKTFSGFVYFSEICDIVNYTCTFITELFLAIWIF